MKTGGKCRKCGAALKRSGRGQPRRYCGAGCRRAAEHEVRRFDRRIEKL